MFEFIFRRQKRVAGSVLIFGARHLCRFTVHSQLGRRSGLKPALLGKLEHDRIAFQLAATDLISIIRVCSTSN
jgi:hypothetical protein